MSGVQYITLAEILADPQAAIRPYLDELPTLWWGSVATRSQIDDWVRQGQHGIQERRAETLGSYGCGQVIRAAQFLEQAPRIKSFNRKHDTYGWKHAAERFHKRLNPTADYYVGEGAFLIACWAMGVRTDRKTRGAHVNLSEQAYIADRHDSVLSASEIHP